jgi:hypothetical protein
MKKFKEHSFDFKACTEQLIEFEQLLSANPTLSEREVISPFFRKREHLTALLGTLHTNVYKFDRLAYELDLFGAFACDAAVGDSSSHAYCLVEFENADKDSIFKKAGRATSDWSDRFEHGFSQLVDWMWILDDMRGKKAYRETFGCDEINGLSLLVIGRSNFLTDGERERLTWRRENIAIGKSKVHCFTFDELLDALKKKMMHFQMVAMSETMTEPTLPDADE